MSGGGGGGDPNIVSRVSRSTDSQVYPVRSGNPFQLFDRSRSMLRSLDVPRRLPPCHNRGPGAAESALPWRLLCTRQEILLDWRTYENTSTQQQATQFFFLLILVGRQATKGRQFNIVGNQSKSQPTSRRHVFGSTYNSKIGQDIQYTTPYAKK